MSKKKEPKRGKKRKADKGKFKSPTKAQSMIDAHQRAQTPKAMRRAAMSAVVEAAVLWRADPTSADSRQLLMVAVDQLPIRSRPQSATGVEVRTAEVDFSTVMVTRTFITRVYSDYSMTTPQKIAITRVINEIMAVIARARMSPATPSPILDKASVQRAKGQEDGVDLATLDKVASSEDAVEEVRAFGSIGSAGLRHLKHFVDCAKELVLADVQVFVQAASAG